MASESTVPPLAAGAGTTKLEITNTTTAPMTLVEISSQVSMSWTRTRRARGLWSAGPSRRDPNGVRRLERSAAVLSPRLVPTAEGYDVAAPSVLGTGGERPPRRPPDA